MPALKYFYTLKRKSKAHELSVSLGTECRPLNNRVTPNPGKLAPVDQMHGDLCYLLFTSGTTGKPKGVPIYHRILPHFLT